MKTRKKKKRQLDGFQLFLAALISFIHFFIPMEPQPLMLCPPLFHLLFFLP